MTDTDTTDDTCDDPSLSRYINHRCRCRGCRDENAANGRRYRARLRARQARRPQPPEPQENHPA